MAAMFTEVTLPEMDSFLRRAFRALKPKPNTWRGEVAYDLFLSDKVVVRVYTSISPSRGVGADIGSDAIRVGLYSTNGRPLKSGKMPIVKRTQNWRDNLRERVEEAMEQYQLHEDEIEAGKYINW